MKKSKITNEKCCQKKQEEKGVHFFKIIRPACINDQRLAIPKQFSSNIRKKLSNTAVLQVPSGKNWPVELREDEGQYWFQNGWHEFMEYHSICAGHFLVFKYDGHSQFDVVIFDTTASEIQYPCEMNDLEESDEDEDIVEIMELSPTKNVIDEPNVHKVGRNCNAGVLFDGQAEMGTSQQNNANCDQEMKQGENCGKKRKLSVCNHRSKIEKDVSSSVSKRRATLDFDCQKNYNIPLSVPPGFKSTGHKKDALHLVKGTKGQKQTKSPSPFPQMRIQRSHNQITVTKAVEVDSPVESSALQLKRPTELSIVPKIYASLRKKEEAFKASMAFMFKNPYCAIYMRHSYVNEGFTLNVPYWFGKTHLRDGVVTLCVPNGSTWQVGCAFRSYYVKLLKGWQTFVRENHLEVGDICFFELVDMKYMELNVAIFRVHQYPKSISTSFTSRFAAAQGKERAIIAAMSFTSANPFCTVTKHPTNVNLCFRLNLPTAFAKKYLSNGFEGIALRVLDGGMCHAEGDSRDCHIINKGWKTFVSDNHLKEDDVCIFQLVDGEHIELKISIFRDLKLSRNLPHQ